MKVIFAGGGTGGHINPAISIADYAKKNDSNFEALFIGTEKGLEKKLVPQAGYDIKYIDIAGFDRKHLLKNVEESESKMNFRVINLNESLTEVFDAFKIVAKEKKINYQMKNTELNI